MKKLTLLGFACIAISASYSQNTFKVTDLKYDGKIYQLMDGNDDIFAFQGVKMDLNYIDASGKVYCQSNEKLKCLSYTLLGNKIIEFATTKGGLATTIFDIKKCTISKKLVDVPVVGTTGYNSFVSSPSKRMALFIEADGYRNPLAFHGINQEGEIMWSYQWNMKYEGTPMRILSASIDDEGNAVFFARATIDKNTFVGMFYRNHTDGKISQIPFELNIDGTIVFDCKFDQNGDIHVYGGSFSEVYLNKNKGFFYGKYNPDEDTKLIPKLYGTYDDDEFIINWRISNFFVDTQGNTTLCAVGNYTKMGKGGYTELLVLKFDPSGKELWSKEITNINLMSVSHQVSELEYSFIKVGKNYMFLYYGNREYLKYEKGIDLNVADPEPKLNQLQYYLITDSGEVSTGTLQDNMDFRFKKDYTVFRDNSTILFSKEGFIKKLESE